MIRRFFHGLSPVGHRWGKTPLDLARAAREAEVVQLLEAVAWPHGRSSDSPPLQILAPRPRPLHHRPNEGRMLRDFCVISASLANVQTSIGCPPSMQGVYATCCWNQLYFGFHVLGHCGLKEIVSFVYSSSCNLLRREVELKKIAVCEQHLDVSFC